MIKFLSPSCCGIPVFQKRGGRQVLLLMISIFIVGVLIPPNLYAVKSNSVKPENVTVVAKTGGDFSSIQQAIDTAVPGDLIVVHPGLYHEKIVIDKPDISIEAYDPKDPPVIDGANQDFANTSHAWTHVQGRIYKSSFTWYKDQVTDKQFTTYYNDGSDPDHICLQVYEDGQLLRGYRNRHDPDYPGFETKRGNGGPYRSLDELDPANDNGKLPNAKNRPDIRLPGRFMYKEDADELYIWSVNEDNPSNHTYYIPEIVHLIEINAPRSVLRNLVLKHAAGFAVAFNENANDSVMKNCYLINNIKNVRIHTSGVKIQNNMFQQKGFWERYWYDDCKGTLLHGGTIASMSGISNTEVSRNTFYGYYGAMRGGPTKDVKVFENIFSHTMSIHISGDSATNLQIYRNVFSHNDDNALGLSNDGQTGPVWVYRNVFYATDSITKDGSSSPDAEPAAYVYHNTIAIANLLSHNPYPYPPYKRKFFHNNIIHYVGRVWRYSNCNPDNGWSFYPFTNGPDADYNLYWSDKLVAGSDDKFATLDLSISSPTEYKASDLEKFGQETGVDVHSFFANPLFVNSAISQTSDQLTFKVDNFSDMNYSTVVDQGYDILFPQHYNKIYHYFDVLADSPAIDSGEVLPSTWPDIVGVVDGKPDIGAQEY